MSLFHRKAKKLSAHGRAGKRASILFLLLLVAFSVFPLIYVICNAFKPLEELFVYPPRLFFRKPTLDNFRDLFIATGQSWVPFIRYVFNTVTVTVIGTAGHLFLASMAAYIFAKHDFPGGRLIFRLIVLSLMFTPAVTNIPNYIIMAKLGLIDTYFAVILPSLQYSLGLYLMKQFMETIPDSVLESARTDGAGEFLVYWKIAMPSVKPAWLTLIILMIQSLWNSISPYTYSEELKSLPQALSQILAGGIARTGAAAAAALIMISVPILTFVLSQSQVIETMSTSGMKE